MSVFFSVSPVGATIRCVPTKSRSISCRLLYFLTPLSKWFIGLLPRFLFFVKVPYHGIYPFHSPLPPLTLFPFSADSLSANFVRRSIFRNHFSNIPPVIFHALFAQRSLRALGYSVESPLLALDRYPFCFSAAGRLPEFRQFPLCSVLNFHRSLVFSGCRLTVGRNHRFSYPPFNVFVRRIPTALCRPPVDLLTRASVCSLIEISKHFLFVSFFLYLYYSTYFLFVKGFLKNFLNFFEFF